MALTTSFKTAKKNPKKTNKCSVMGESSNKILGNPNYRILCMKYRNAEGGGKIFLKYN